MPETEQSFERALRGRVDAGRGTKPRGCESALAELAAGTGFDFGRARARAGFARGHLLDVVIELPGGRGGRHEQRAAESLCELLLGEARSDDWLGKVSLVPAPREGPLKVVQARPSSENFFPIAELLPAFDAAIAGLHAGLPGEPLWAVGGEQRWVLLELDVEALPAYPGQSDVALASTFLPEMLRCFLSGASFASARFSARAELFGYLKSRRREGDLRRAVAERRVLEDALDSALVSERAGRVVGSGMGVVYSYVDFAFDALDRAVDVIRAVAGRVGLPAESWISFCDTPLAEDWIALAPGGPAPPR
ncbi:MAG TPA: hypothetical protein VGK73_37170 [Polyangiaceae bacterium]